MFSFIFLSKGWINKLNNTKELQKKWKEIGKSSGYPQNIITASESMEQIKCRTFFEELADLLKDNYVVIESCNADFSKYLCVRGTENEISYSGKPNLSFRMSDHWNWYSSLRKCPDINYVQCYSVDAPEPRPRKEYGKATMPIDICQVSIFIDGEYRAVYGEVFDRSTKRIKWLEMSPKKVVELYFQKEGEKA